MFKLTMDATQVRAMVNWLGKFDTVAREPETMSAGVKNIGMGMQLQFSREGGHFGNNWQNLSDTTKNLREARGYSPEHPILIQSGSLKNATADSLRAYVTSTTAMVRVAPGINMVASSMPLQFTAKASGAKMQNHFGGTITLSSGMSGYLPKRAFFGLGAFEASMAFEAIFRRLMSEWGSRSGYVTRIR